MGKSTTSVSFTLQELNELYYATSKNVDRQVETYYARPCAYTKLQLDTAYAINNKVAEALEMKVFES